MTTSDANSGETPADAADAARDRRMSRRKWLRRSLAAAAVGTFLYTWRVEPHWVEVVERPLPIVGLGDGLIGRRLVQVSDLHVGPVVDQSFLLDSMERLGELAPDLIVVTGDFMTCLGSEQVDRVREVMQAMPAAPLGRFAVHGNHDYGGSFKQAGVAGRLAEGLERLGVRVLRNEVAKVDGLQLMGVDDVWGGFYRPEEALAKLDGSQPVLALLHNPDGADHPAWAQYQGWILCGHTHGGQCKPPFLSPPILPVHNKRYVAGAYDLGPGRQMYINRGLGYLSRVRFNCRPEITVFTLERAEATAQGAPV